MANFSKGGNKWLELELLPSMLIVGSLTGKSQCTSPTEPTESDSVKIVVRYNHYMIISRKQLDREVF